MLSDLASSAKYLEVKGQQKIHKDEELQTEVAWQKPATQQLNKRRRRRQPSQSNISIETDLIDN